MTQKAKDEATIFTITPSPCLDKVLHLDTDRLEPTTIRVKGIEDRPGGKGIDVSRAVKSLGGRTVAICPLGPPTGDEVEALVKEEGLDVSPVKVAGETRINTILVNAKGDEYRINTQAPALTPAEKAKFYNHIASTVRHDSYVTIGGSSPVGFRFNWSQAVIKNLRGEKRCTVALDTQAEVTMAALAVPETRPNYIKPNLREFHEFLLFAKLKRLQNGLLPPDETSHPKLDELGLEDFLEWKFTNPSNPALVASWPSLLTAVGHFYEHYDRSVVPILSLGRMGTLTLHESGARASILHCYHPGKVAVVARVGAGDSLLGAFLLGLGRKMDPRDALQFAVAAATVRVSMTVKEEQVSYINTDMVEGKVESNEVVVDEYPLDQNLECANKHPMFLERSKPIAVRTITGPEPPSASQVPTPSRVPSPSPNPINGAGTAA
jgi:fructose-1-phosphate kinase PfkB-like protein